MEIGGLDEGRDTTYTVYFNNNSNEFECSCHLFEYRGIICRHVTFVLITKRIRFVLDKYILRRWRKDVKRPHSKVTVTDSGWAVTVDNKRYEELCTYFSDIADAASAHEEDTLELMELLRGLKIKMDTRKSRSGSNIPSSSQFVPHKIIDEMEVPSVGMELNNPTRVRRKGQYKRFVGEGMKQSDKAKRKHKAMEKEKPGKSSTQRNGRKRSPTLHDVEEVQPTKIFHTPHMEQGNGYADHIVDNDGMSGTMPSNLEDDEIWLTDGLGQQWNNDDCRAP